jgi:putative ABC transport system permease protein
MRDDLRRWLRETHGRGFELLRHFTVSFFDSELTSIPGEWSKVAAGIVAVLLSLSIIITQLYLGRYGAMARSGANALAILKAIRGDQFGLITDVMAAMAVATVLQWQSLFPSLRDYLALAGLPIRPHQIFLAKGGALLLVFTGFVLVLVGPPALVFASIIDMVGVFPAQFRVVAACFAAMAGGCVFVFFTLLACQGLLLNLLPPRMFARASMALQAVIFAGTLGGVSLIGRQPMAWWWPPMWFLRLWEAIATGHGSARASLLAIAVPVAAAALLYLVSYHRYRRLLLEASPAGQGHAMRGHAGHGPAALFDLWIRNPREQAAFSFICKGLARSRMHRLILLAYAGLAIGWITSGALDTPPPSLRNQGVYGLIVVLAPLTLAILVTIGLRYLFSLPLEPRANWMFQIADREGRVAWLAAVERFVVWCGIAPLFLAGAPAAVAVLGPMRAAAATLLAAGAAWLAFEYLFRRWRKLPFTCSYLPGKQPAWLVLTRGMIALPLLGAAGEFLLTCSADPAAFLALFSFEAALGWWMRAARRKRWEQTALLWEELPEAAVEELHLQPAAEIVSTATPAAASEMFSESLVASRGLLPRAWAEEMNGEPVNPFTFADTLREDVRYGMRLIRRSPLFSAVVVLTLTVGIGINASVFTVVSGLAFRPHVYRDPGSFVRIVPLERDRHRVREVSYDEYRSWRDVARSVRQLAAWTYFPALIGDADASGTFGMAASCNFFVVDGIDRPTLGRLFDTQDCLSSGQTPVAVINETIWHSRFGSDPLVIGRMVPVNNRPVMVIGVVPDRTGTWTRPTSIWVPLTAQAFFSPGRDVIQNQDYLWLMLAGRLAPGYTRAQAEAEFNTLAQQANRFNRRTAVTTTDGSWMQEIYLTADGRDLMLVGFFLGAFNLVLLISCANVATLLLSRAAARRKEIAVRLSLGAPRVRLIRMLLTESLLLAAMAGAASAWLVWRVPRPLFRAVAAKAPDFPMAPDWHTFAYISAVVFATGILAGLAPAMDSVKVDLAGSMKGLAPSAFGGARLRGWLVSAQVALSMVLLVEAGLFARSEDRNLRGNPGYAPEHVVVLPMRFGERPAMPAATARMSDILDRLKTMRGVQSVAFSEGMPMIHHRSVDIRPPLRNDASLPVDIYTASPHFLETMGIPLLQGRDLDERDRHGVIVSQSLAQALWRRGNPLGRTFTVPDLGEATVIGVARDVEALRIGGSDNPAVYVMSRFNAFENTVSVRVSGNASAAAAKLRASLHQGFPDMGILARPLQKWIDDITESLWNVVALIAILGVVATALATSGIYGAVSFAVSQQTRELGIRVALGAQRLDIVREVLVAGGKPVAKGLVLGLWMSVALAAGLRQSVQGSPLRLDTNNPLLYVAAGALLAAAAMAAMLPAAHRGAKADPLEALRCE